MSERERQGEIGRENESYGEREGERGREKERVTALLDKYLIFILFV